MQSADRSGLVTSSSTGLVLWTTLGAAFIAAVFLTNWPTYQYVVLGGLAPIWYYALPAAVAVPVFFARPETVIRLCHEPLAWWFVLYVVSGAIWLLLSQSFIEYAAQQWRLRVLALFFFVTAAVITLESRHRLVGLAVLCAVLLATVFNWWDALRPYLFVPAGIEGATAGRGAGLFINANAAAAFVTAATIVALPFAPMRFRAALLVLAFVGIAATVSRSGLLCAAIIVALAFCTRLLDRTQALVLVIAVPVLVAGAALYYDVLLSSSDDMNMHRIMQRLNWFQDLQKDDSIEDRIYPAIRAWEMFLDAPLTGKGVGVTSIPALGDGTHNMYLMLMAEQGFTGLLLYLLLLGVVANRGLTVWRDAVTADAADRGRGLVVYAAFLAAYGFFSHNVLEEPHGIFLLAFLFAASCGPRTPGEAAYPYERRLLGARPPARLSNLQGRS